MFTSYWKAAVIISTIFFLAGCGGEASVSVSYHAGSGIKPGGAEQGIKISSPSFKKGTLTFNYQNTKKDSGWQVFTIVIKLYDRNNTLVNTEYRNIYPGLLSRIPCNVDNLSIPVDTKGKSIRRVEVEHVYSVSSTRYGKYLDRAFGF